MELQISHSICTEVPKEDILSGKATRDRRNTQEIVRVEAGGNNRGRSMPGSHPYAGKYSPKDQCVRVRRILEREKHPDHIRETRKPEV